jgi:hypothetical protein
VAANVVGLGLGTAFRFWSYRRWVFPELLPEAAAHPAEDHDPPQESGPLPAPPDGAPVSADPLPPS